MFSKSFLARTILFLIGLFFTSEFLPAQTVSLENLKADHAATKDPLVHVRLANRIAYDSRNVSPDSTVLWAQRNIAEAQQYNFEKELAIATLTLAHGYVGKAFYEAALERTNAALVLAEKLNFDSLLGAAHNSRAVNYMHKGNFDLAIENSNKALNLFQKIGHKEGLIKGKVLRAQIFQVKNDLPAAEAILLEILNDPPDDKRGLVSSYHTLANIYGMEGKYDSALALDAKGLELCDRHDLASWKSPLYDNMANCFMFTGRFAKANRYFYESLKIDSAMGNGKQMSDTYLNLGQLSLMQKNYRDAIGFINRSITLSRAAGYRQGTYGAYLLLSKAFKLAGEKDSALAAVNTGYDIKDSIINEKSENKIAEMETLLQTEKKEQQLRQQQLEINKKNWLLAGVSIAVVLLTLLTIVYFRKRSLQNKIGMQTEVLRQQDIATKAIIEAEENERKRIAADLHDGIGQMMSAAKMNLSVFEQELKFTDEAERAKFETVINLVDESCRELRNVSHQMMPNALLKSGLAGAVKEFLSKIDTRVLKVNLHVEGLQDRLEPDVETVLYRVIQECVNNVMKHAGANHLDIAIICDNDGLDATIEDNGRGFNASRAMQNPGIGIKNTVSRIQYLKGTIDFNSSPGKGTVVAIHIPFNGKKA